MTALDDLLVGYLLNALDADERRQFEERLRRDPALREQLTELQSKLAPLALDAEVPEPPPRLVLNTLARVAEEHRRRPVAPPRAAPSPEYAPTRRRFRRADVLVAAVLLLFVGALSFPWLVRQWQEYQIRACQRNLVVFWAGLQRHSQINENAFPRLAEDGPRSFAGILVPILNDGKVLDSDASILCPAVGKRAPDSRSVHQLTVLWDCRGPDAFRTVLRDVGGSYAYPLGYWEGDHLVGLRRDTDDGRPIMADAPSSAGCLANSDNHGRRGQNVLFVGGNVRWCTSRSVGPDGDDIFLNQNNEIAAGLSRTDVVLGSGDACPYPCRP